MAKKNDNDYFSYFITAVEYTCKAAEMLQNTLQNYEPETIKEKLESLHMVEHSADLAKHDMVARLVKEFITPIEREDIMNLADAIDDVTDGIEDVLIRAYMFNLNEIKPDAIAFSAVIVECCQEMGRMINEFRNFRKSAALKDQVIRINQLEEDGDRIYNDSMRELYVEARDAIEILTWSEMYDRLERCCDCCEDVADVVERVIMKNT